MPRKSKRKSRRQCRRGLKDENKEVKEVKEVTEEKHFWNQMKIFREKNENKKLCNSCPSKQLCDAKIKCHQFILDVRILKI